MKTGWSPGMLQDDSRELSKWLSTRVDSRHVAREAAKEIEMSKALELADKAGLYTASTYAGDLIHSMAAELRRLDAENAQLRAELGDCAKYLKEGETTAQRIQREIDDNHAVLGLLASARAELEAIYSAEPVFWYRPVCGGEMYEGPHHNNAQLGRMLREEKPGEWLPLIPLPERKS